MIDQFKFLNPQALISIFGKIPKLEESELLDVRLKRDGPTLVIQLMTKGNVENKPKRWNIVAHNIMDKFKKKENK
ncbi:Protein of unknown function [Bacillus cereus]|nr:Protein of unknown function [Bacillus cereus]